MVESGGGVVLGFHVSPIFNPLHQLQTTVISKLTVSAGWLGAGRGRGRLTGVERWRDGEMERWRGGEVEGAWLYEEWWAAELSGVWFRLFYFQSPLPLLRYVLLYLLPYPYTPTSLYLYPPSPISMSDHLLTCSNIPSNLFNNHSVENQGHKGTRAQGHKGTRPQDDGSGQYQCGTCNHHHHHHPSPPAYAASLLDFYYKHRSTWSRFVSTPPTISWILVLLHPKTLTPVIDAAVPITILATIQCPRSQLSHMPDSFRHTRGWLGVRPQSTAAFRGPASAKCWSGRACCVAS